MGWISRVLFSLPFGDSSISCLGSVNGWNIFDLVKSCCTSLPVWEDCLCDTDFQQWVRVAADGRPHVVLDGDEQWLSEQSVTRALCALRCAQRSVERSRFTSSGFYCPSFERSELLSILEETNYICDTQFVGVPAGPLWKTLHDAAEHLTMRVKRGEGTMKAIRDLAVVELNAAVLQFVQHSALQEPVVFLEPRDTGGSSGSGLSANFRVDSSRRFELSLPVPLGFRERNSRDPIKAHTPQHITLGELLGMGRGEIVKVRQMNLADIESRLTSMADVSSWELLFHRLRQALAGDACLPIFVLEKASSETKREGALKVLAQRISEVLRSETSNYSPEHSTPNEAVTSNQVGSVCTLIFLVETKKSVGRMFFHPKFG